MFIVAYLMEFYRNGLEGIQTRIFKYVQKIGRFKADKLLLNRWTIISNVISNVILLNDELFLKNNMVHTLGYT